MLNSTNVFLPDLYFVDHTRDAIPGGLTPKNMPAIELAGEHITPLLPLNPHLLDHLTPEALCDRVGFQLRDAEAVEVSLDLSQTGILGDRRISHTYELKQENAFDGVPILEIWPNLRSPAWKEYYVFYYDAGLGKDTFQIELDGIEPGSRNIHAFKDQSEVYRMFRLEEFPTVIQCQNEANQIVGIILLKQPHELAPSKTWKVGVDFGYSRTNIYIQRKPGVEDPLPLPNLLEKITASPMDTRFPVLLDYFIPDEFLLLTERLPIQNVVTTRGGDRTQKRVIFDGRIYILNLKTYDPEQEWIETNIRVGGNELGCELFLNHLALHISAIAASEGVQKIQWILSYPPNASNQQQTQYLRLWQSITENLQPRTGINYLCPDTLQSDDFRTTDLAFAQYFSDIERYDLIYTSCIQLEPTTAHLSIWDNNHSIHHCTLAFGAQEILSKFLELNPKFIEQRFGVDPDYWKGLRGSEFQPRLDVLLRWASQAWLRDQRAMLNNAEDVQDLVRLMALGFSGLYYYIGILLRVLHQEGKYSRDRITPVYLGGNGSRLLHWLDPNGEFTPHSEVNDFLSRILARGSGFENSEEPTRLSNNPEHEVAHGLVSEGTFLRGWERLKNGPVIAGEDCQINGANLYWNQRLEMKDDIRTFQIPTLANLSKFLYDFHVGLRDLEMDGIHPLSGYNWSVELSDNRKLWDGTRCELEQILQRRSLRYENEPPFILGLKALLNHLARQWAGEKLKSWW